LDIHAVSDCIDVLVALMELLDILITVRHDLRLVDSICNRNHLTDGLFDLNSNA
jgi:hypothetical protein